MRAYNDIAGTHTHQLIIAPRRQNYSCVNVEAVAKSLQRCVTLAGLGFEIRPSRTRITRVNCSAIEAVVLN